MAEILIERIVIREVSYVHFSVTVKRGLFFLLQETVEKLHSGLNY